MLRRGPAAVTISVTSQSRQYNLGEFSENFHFLLFFRHVAFRQTPCIAPWRRHLCRRPERPRPEGASTRITRRERRLVDFGGQSSSDFELSGCTTHGHVFACAYCALLGAGARSTSG